MREMQVDEKTRDYIRNWGRSEVPTAQVTGGKVNPGTYRALATLGFVERRGPAAICCVHFLVLQNQAYTPMATLSLAMPVTKKTELHVNSFLHVLGWDGRVWPYDFDGGWPDNSPEDAEQIRIMLQKLKLGATLTFPGEAHHGVRLLDLPIVKRTSPFPLAPFEPVPEDQPAPVIHLERFRDLCKDASPFTLLN
jgi:hypothetical protein